VLPPAHDDSVDEVPSSAPEPPLVAISIALGERQRRRSDGNQLRIAGTGCVVKCTRSSRALAAAASAGGSSSAASVSRPLRPLTWWQSHNYV